MFGVTDSLRTGVIKEYNDIELSEYAESQAFKAFKFGIDKQQELKYHI